MDTNTRDALAFLQSDEQFRFIIRKNLVEMDGAKADTHRDFLQTVKIGRPAFKSAEQFKETHEEKHF